MKKLYFIAPVICLMAILGGCGKQGKFEQADLSLLEQGFESRQTIDDVTISVKRLTQKDRE